MLSSDKNGLPDPGNLKITIRKFYRVSGASTQLKGVEPDIVLPDVLNYSTQVGEVSLDNPLPWDTIQPANYEKLNLVQPHLETLKARSDERIATNQDFLYVKQDIEQFQKLQADKTASINERETLKERERIFHQNKTRDAERSARKPDGVKVYDITVKNSELPGLTEAKPDADGVPQIIAEFLGTNQLNQVSNAFSNLNASLTNFPPGTNLAAITTTTNSVKSADAKKKSAPPFDPMLEETERILLDYISLLGKNSPMIANQ
jgi:carboxyl-terminal processing protease